MRKPLLRIPYTDILPTPLPTPCTAASVPGAVAALKSFFTNPAPHGLPQSTVVLSGAGLSVASGLADYRGVNGTYRVNKTYRPIYYHEFVHNHEARKRYWARSFLGLSSLDRAGPNTGHFAIRDLAKLGLVRSVITQNVDSFHTRAHPDMQTLELHGYLRSTICTSCKSEFSRLEFQKQLADLNPRWNELLQKVLASGALDAENPVTRERLGIKTNPDGDVDLPDAPYTTFRYPPCPSCLENPTTGKDGQKQIVKADADGAWTAPSTGGVLKPAVIMFGENIPSAVKHAAEEAIDNSGKLLVVGTSLATYSAWRLAKRAKDRGMPIAIVNMGGVRGEDLFFGGLDPDQPGAAGVRTEESISEVLPALVTELRDDFAHHPQHIPTATRENTNVFKDMLS